MIADNPKHKCGIVGIASKTTLNMPEKLFYPLFALQHRGQESTGIAYNRRGNLVFYKDLGMVDSVLSHYLMEKHESNVGIGHVRYSTHGTNKLENAQPIVITCNKGQIALAHNGNISNSEILSSEIFYKGSIFQSTTDTELILHYIACSRKKTFEQALVQSLRRLEGAYSLVLIHNNNLFAIRDPFGFRPLVMGRKDDLVVFASETCALDILQIPFEREIAAGEIIKVNGNNIKSTFFDKRPKKKQCIFELIYFARPDSIVFGYSVHLIRKKLGELLAKNEKNSSDLVIPIPDSGNSAALGYSQASGIPFDQGLTRNHYSGRTFIQPSQSKREFGVRMKLFPIKRAVKGKRITIIDDSLVRGTTSKILVNLLKNAGAKEIHLRLSAPEIKYPCFFGIDIPTAEELISNKMNPGEIARNINADSVCFLPLDKLKQCVDNADDFCYACFSGNYPVRINSVGRGKT